MFSSVAEKGLTKVADSIAGVIGGTAKTKDEKGCFINGFGSIGLGLAACGLFIMIGLIQYGKQREDKK
jgi:hypothetical protein